MSRESHCLLGHFLGDSFHLVEDFARAHEGLAADEAEEFHAWQIGELEAGGVDFIIAETLGYLGEGLIALEVIKEAGLPAVINDLSGSSTGANGVGSPSYWRKAASWA